MTVPEPTSESIPSSSSVPISKETPTTPIESKKRLLEPPVDSNQKKAKHSDGEHVSPKESDPTPPSDTDIPTKATVTPTNNKESLALQRDQVDVLVLDIEGTITPITFVKDVLFPYIRTNAASFLNKHWEETECQEKVQLLRDQAAADVAAEMKHAVLIPTWDASNKNSTQKETIINSIMDNITWQMDADRKIGALKQFQGYMWRSGYETGQLQGIVYEDVVPALQRWQSQNIPVYIYSSGSVEAQKLLLGYSKEGDLLEYFAGHFDTSIGLKVNAESYTAIAEQIGKDSSRILFISDNVLELKAATDAGFLVRWAVRPGNAPVLDEEAAKWVPLKTYKELF